MATAARSETNLTLTREFAFPRDLVWTAWTEPEHIAQWFGPEGFSTRVEEYEFKTGGRFKYVMIGPDGNEYPGVSVFKEITPKDRIVATDDFSDNYIEKNPDVPSGMIVTETFEDLGARTKVTISIDHASAEDKRKHEEMGVVAGWGSTLDKLEKHLASLKQ
jgi:uncharacterized protein YndB with AHSA1/START domain